MLSSGQDVDVAVLFHEVELDFEHTAADLAEQEAEGAHVVGGDAGIVEAERRAAEAGAVRSGQAAGDGVLPLRAGRAGADPRVVAVVEGTGTPDAAPLHAEFAGGFLGGFHDVGLEVDLRARAVEVVHKPDDALLILFRGLYDQGVAVFVHFDDGGLPALPVGGGEEFGEALLQGRGFGIAHADHADGERRVLAGDELLLGKLVVERLEVDFLLFFHGGQDLQDVALPAVLQAVGAQQPLEHVPPRGFLDIEADRPAHAGAEHDVDPGGGREAAQGDAHIHVVELEGDGNGGQGTGRGLFLFFRVAHDHAGLGAQIGGCGRIALRILRELLPVIHELLLFVLLGGAGREQTEQGQEAKDGNGPLSHSILHSPQGRGEAVR